MSSHSFIAITSRLDWFYGVSTLVGLSNAEVVIFLSNYMVSSNS